MAELGISIAGKLIEVIGSEIIKEICDVWGYRSHLEDLHKTVTIINKVLLDAETKRELSNTARGYIEDLKDVVYDADDLFDEFLTLADLKLLDVNDNKKSGKFSEKVRRFFSSRKKKMSQAYMMSCKVKEIKQQLDSIADKHTKFGFSVDYKPICRRREETCSYLIENDIIGRDKDKETIIDMLLNPSLEEGFCFLTIVGMGGLGKTALAQLVYNDEKIKSEFPKLKLWVCVSDQDGEIFDVKAILCKIIELATGCKVDGSCTMELVQNQFQEQLRGQKFFLVLDDVWNEDRENWLSLKKFLMLGQGGSRIVITTRSETTSAIIGDEHAYKLQGLSEEDSWQLFKMSAFSNGSQEDDHDDELVEIGKKIVAKCHSIPLAIKVVGSLLYGQDVRKWESFEQSGLSTNGEGSNRIMSILMLSYHNLESSLKSCFSYCAVFPKDEVIKKNTLIELWMAQGYIVPLEGGQSIDDAAEEHFVILLRRCFFQDVQKDNFGDIYTIKIHDLMHDVAKQVGREETCVVTCTTNKPGGKIRHMQHVGEICPDLISSCSSKIRSFICCNLSKEPLVDSIIDKWMCLRALNLSRSSIEILPDSIGKLLHLRFLDLSHNRKLEILPDAITMLHNLQTLNVHSCHRLRELPKDFSKLVNLWHFDVYSGVVSLSGMPLGLDRLSSLRVLTYFVVGNRSSSSDDDDDGELKALKPLINIKGDISIIICEKYTTRKVEGINDGVGGGYLKSMKYLTSLEIMFYSRKDGCVRQEALLEDLEPPSNLKGFRLHNYNGTTIPKWGRTEGDWAVFLSRLVKISLDNCINLTEMPVLSKLPHLKILVLQGLYNLEYMENTSESTRNGSEATKESTTFFPSLKQLRFFDITKLKGWFEGEQSIDYNHSLNSKWKFPSVSNIRIHNCPNLTSIPHSPSLEELDVTESKKFQNVKTRDDTNCVKLQELDTDNARIMKSVPTKCLTSLSIMGRGEDEERENESEVVEAFQSCASSLRSLSIDGINRLNRLCGETGLQHFSALEEIRIGRRSLHNTPDVVCKDEEEEKEDGSTMFWKSFPQTLRSLTFVGYCYRNSLPEGMQYLTSLKTLDLYDCINLTALPEWISSLHSLQTLYIQRCSSLKSLPEAMRNLTSLDRLVIKNCPDLVERCKEPDGEDRPKIQHIPHIELWK